MSHCMPVVCSVLCGYLCGVRSRWFVYGQASTTATSSFLVGTVCKLCGAGSVKRYDVRLSVCPFMSHSSKPAATGLLLWARRAGDIDYCCNSSVQQTTAGSATLSAHIGSWTQTCFIKIQNGLPFWCRTWETLNPGICGSKLWLGSRDCNP